MHRQLLVTGVPHDLAAASTSLPALGALLRQAGETVRSAGDWQAWLCRQFGVARQQDWPVAPLAALGEGVEVGSAYWLCASPVCLQPQRDALVMLDGAVDDLDIAQAEELVRALNTHFETESLHFYAPHPLRWYLRVDTVPQLETFPLHRAQGRRVNDMLPHGADALEWHRHGTEMQMLLHAHPVNTAREQAGRMPVNGVWLWGGGILPPVPVSSATGVLADGVLAGGLARASKAPLRAVPADAPAWLAQSDIGRTQLAILERAHQSGERDNVHAWMQGLEETWFSPLLQALRHGRLARLELYLASEDSVIGYTLARADLWKFWRSFPKWGGRHG